MFTASQSERDLDDDLMARAAADDQEAFRELVARHMRPLVGYCARMTGDLRTGEEAAQETWLALWAARARYRGDGKFRVLLYVTARNRCANVRRARWRWRRLFDDGPAPDVAALAPASAGERLEDEWGGELLAALGRLPEKLREAIVLRYGQDLEYAEIAAITGSREPTVRSRVFHGLRRLRELLGGEEP